MSKNQKRRLAKIEIFPPRSAPEVAPYWPTFPNTNNISDHRDKIADIEKYYFRESDSLVEHTWNFNIDDQLSIIDNHFDRAQLEISQYLSFLKDKNQSFLIDSAFNSEVLLIVLDSQYKMEFNYKNILFHFGRVIPDDDTDWELNDKARWDLVDDFARRNPGLPVSKYAQALFRGVEPTASKTSPPLPAEAPEKYRGLRGPESPPDFVKRVYGEWLGRGLTRAHVRKLDPTLSTAINNWMRRPGNEWPSDVDLPTIKEQNDRWVERVRNEGLVSALGDADPEFALREVARLRGALERRKE